MAAKKWYAVRKGRVPGIYVTWDECKAQIDRYSGAVFKGFSSKEEAEAYLSAAESNRPSRSGGTEKKPDIVELDALCTDGILCAYTDGSFTDAAPPQNGYGICYVRDGVEVGRQYGPCNADPAIRNIGGELMAASTAIDTALDRQESRLIICHDLMNIQLWANGIYQCSIDESRAFRDKVAAARQGGLSITFGWVHGHDGNLYNECADSYAALGAQGKEMKNF